MATFYQRNSSSTQSSLFSRQHQTFIQYSLSIVIAMVLMIGDVRYNAFSYLRAGCSFIISPVQYAIDYPLRSMQDVYLLFSSKQALIKENMQLRYQQTLLQAQLQKFMLIRNENIQLKELLAASSSPNTRATAAQILAVETSNTRQLLALNKGKRDGVYVGQPVLDAKGVMGQVIDVGFMTSTVLLISDAKCAVPVRNDRTGERGILMGTNSFSRLSLTNLPKTSSIEKGDLLVTSGLGRRYPEGYPVAQVDRIDNLPGEEFMRIEARPIASLNRSRLVLLIWPDEEDVLLTAQVSERLKAMDELPT